MESTYLSQFLEEVYSKNISHCALCYRTEKEVRLTTPLVFKMVLGALKYSENEFENNKICYMCEARANAVSKFVDMIQLALEIKRAFDKTNKASGKLRRTRFLRSIDNFHNSFNKMRTKTQYTNTEVLVVDALDVDKEESKSDTPSQEKESTETQNQTLEEIETVIIDDDGSDDHKHPKLVPLEKLLEEKNPLELLPPQPPPASSQVNVAIGSDGFLYLLPTTSAGNAILEKPFVTQNILLNPGLSNVARENGLQGTSPAKTTEKRPVDVPQQTIKKARFSNVDASDGRDDDDEVRDDDDDDDDAISDNEVVFVNGDGDKELVAEEQVVKFPIKTADTKVDWEDKIPIDIISFVDSKSHSNLLRNATQDLLKDLRDVIDLC